MNGQIARGQFLNPWRVAGWGFAALLLSVPAIAMRFTSEVVWTPLDFMVMGAMIGAVGLGLELAIRASRNNLYRAGAALALLAGFLTTWSNLAVGIIGDGSNPANLLFFGVVALAIIGSVAARSRPTVMARTMMAAGLAQLAVPLVAMIAWRPELTPEFGLSVAINSVFAGMWLLSAGLFSRARTGA